MDSATLPSLMPAPTDNLQTNNPQIGSQADLQPQAPQAGLGGPASDIPSLLNRPNNHTIQLKGSRTEILNDAIAPVSQTTAANGSIIWLAAALILVLIGLSLVFGWGRIWATKLKIVK